MIAMGLNTGTCDEKEGTGRLSSESEEVGA